MIDAVRIRRNTLFALAATLTRMLATMLMFVGIARFFGPEAFGQFTLAHTYLTIFYIFADFGIDILLVTELAYRRNETGEFVQRFFALKVLLSLAAIGIMCGIALFSGVSPGTGLLMVILSAAILGNSATTFVLGILKGHEQFSFEAHTSFWQHLLLLIGLIVLGLTGADILLVAGFFVFSRFAGFFYVLPRAWKYLRLMPLQWSLQDWRTGLREVLPFGFHMLLGTLYFQLDTILVSVWEGDYWVGIYQGAMKLVMLALIVSDVASNAIMPTLSRLLREDEAKGLRTVRLSAKLLLYAGLPVAWIFFLFPEEILSLVYGNEEFVRAALVLKILAFTVFLRFSTDAYALFLTASGKQVRRTIISAVGTGLSLTLNIVLIPLYGIEGAAVASVLVHLVAGSLSIVMMGSATRPLVVRPDLRRGGVVLILIAVGGGVSLGIIQPFAWGMLVIVAASAVVSWLVGLTSDERRTVLTLTGRAG